MIEWRVDFIAPWWVIPLYVVSIAFMVGLIYGLVAVIDRWWHR